MTVFVCPLYVYFDMRINNKKPFELKRRIPDCSKFGIKLP